jgi:TAT (twin-arginine translocation) pathway signal sequence
MTSRDYSRRDFLKTAGMAASSLTSGLPAMERARESPQEEDKDQDGQSAADIRRVAQR